MLEKKTERKSISTFSGFYTAKEPANSCHEVISLYMLEKEVCLLPLLLWEKNYSKQGKRLANSLFHHITAEKGVLGTGHQGLPSSS